MEPEILATLITGAGVVLTIVVSSVFSYKKVNVELNHLRQENKLAYASQLLERRHSSYPIIYNIIISFINSIRVRDIKEENLVELLKNLMEWDQNYSIFLSAKSQFRLFSLLKSIRTLVSSKKEHYQRDERNNIRTTFEKWSWH